jgi:hypothetical protein
MEGGIFSVGEDWEKIKKILDSTRELEDDVARQIVKDYLSRYGFNEKGMAIVNGKTVHPHYLPTVDVMLQENRKHKNAKEIVGSALFKIDDDHVLFLTDTNDTNLRSLYLRNKERADPVADELWSLGKEYDLFWSHNTAIVLASSFGFTFNQSYKNWRMSYRQ